MLLLAGYSVFIDHGEEKEEGQQGKGAQRLHPYQFGKAGRLDSPVYGACVKKTLDGETEQGGEKKGAQRKLQYPCAVIDKGVGEAREGAKGALRQKVAPLLKQPEEPAAADA